MTSKYSGSPGPCYHSRHANLHKPDALSGWAGVEDHLRTCDVDRIRGYADDIDTLLVFAGLFSSILSAFAVQTYQLLQQDSQQTTNQLLAFGISAYLGADSIANTPILNSTVSSLLTQNSSVVLASSRWINSAFFSSIVLSLVAAFLGIRAKQWLRKYMQWNSPLGAPRENILVRQIQVEAWERWNVDLTISLIPMLLELAMFLFLSGIVGLLWTLDDAVAKTVTIVVSTSLFFLASITILPVVSRSCPYKSPSTWALVRTADWILSSVIYAVRFVQTYTTHLRGQWKQAGISLPVDQASTSLSRDIALVRVKHFLGYVWTCAPDWRESEWPTAPSSWRQRALESIQLAQSGRGWTRNYDARDAAKQELLQEFIHLNREGGFVVNPQNYQVSDIQADVLLSNLSQSLYLMRALTWVQRASHDNHVMNYLSECMMSFHNSRAYGTIGELDGLSPALVTDWCIVNTTFGEPRLRSRRDHRLTLLGDVTGLRKQLAVSSTAMAGIRQDTIEWDSRHVLLWDPAVDGSDMLLLLLGADFQRLIEEVLNYTEEDNYAHALNRRILELASILSQAFPRKANRALLRSRFYDGVRTMICSFLSPVAKDYASPFRHIGMEILKVAFHSARVTVNENRHISIEGGRMGVLDYESLLLDYFDDGYQDYGDGKFRAYVFTSIQWLRSYRIENSIGMSQILASMVLAAKFSLDTDQAKGDGQSDVDDCAWIYALRCEHKTLARRCGHIFRQLLHVFERHYLEGNLTGNQVWIRLNIHDCLEVAHKEVESCGVPGCRWSPRSHTCDLYRIPSICDLLPASHDPKSSHCDDNHPSLTASRTITTNPAEPSPTRPSISAREDIANRFQLRETREALAVINAREEGGTIGSLPEGTGGDDAFRISGDAIRAGTLA